MELLSKYHDLTIYIKKETVMCNRKGGNKTFCAYANHALKAGCIVHFNLESLETEKYLPPKLTLKNLRYKNEVEGNYSCLNIAILCTILVIIILHSLTKMSITITYKLERSCPTFKYHM